MKKFIFTFPQSHILKGRCQVIIAEDDEVARDLMFQYHGENWAFQYSEKEWDDYKNSPNRLWDMEKPLRKVIHQIKGVI